MKYVTPENGPQNDGPENPSTGPVKGPEWVIGQTVSGDDYARLPVGSAAGAGNDAITKTSTRGWTRDVGDEDEYPNSDWSDSRTLTHLPDAAEPQSPLAGVELVQFVRDGQVVATAKLGPFQPISTECSLGFKIEPATHRCPRCARPPEPTALGTVVVCHEGSVFVRVDTYGKEPWMRSGFDQRFAWTEIPTVERVLAGPGTGAI